MKTIFSVIVAVLLSLPAGPASAIVTGKDHVPGQLIVGLKAGAHITATAAAARFGGKVVKEIKGEAILLQFPTDADAGAAEKVLVRLSDVGFVEKNGIVRIPPVIGNGAAFRAPEAGSASVSTDAGVQYQWHHTVIRRTAAFTDPAPATPVTVAVIDTGVDYNHPDLSAAGKVIKGKNAVGNNTDPYDDNGHGTHVAGIIAASKGNGQYGEGVCPKCRIYAVKVLDYDGSGSWFDVAAGMADVVANKSTYNIKVANMSLGGGQSATIATQVTAMKTAGIALAAAAGNDNSTDTTYAWPGADPNVAFRVMATEHNDCRTYFSNYSPAANPGLFNIAAPGYDILSTYPDAQYRTLSGTSMATPVVAGAAALVWSKFPADSMDELITRVLNASATTSCGFNVATKRVNLAKAIGIGETGIIGRLLDPFTGKAVSPQSTATTAKLMNGATELGTDASTKGGFYEIKGLSAATGRTLKGVKTGAVNDNYLRKEIAITAGKFAGPYTDAFPVSRAAGNATITLDWKSTQPIIPMADCTTGCKLGWELDLTVKLPDGTWIIPYYMDPFNWPGELMTAPYVKSPRDSYIDYEPLETIVIGNLAANGAYQVVVVNQGDGLIYYNPDTKVYGFGFNPAWTGAGASVQVYSAAAPLTGGGYTAQPASCAAGYYWHVGTITKSGSAYTWTGVNTCKATLP